MQIKSKYTWIILTIVWIFLSLFYLTEFYLIDNSVQGLSPFGKDLSIYLKAGEAYRNGGEVYWNSGEHYGDNFVYPPYTLPVFAALSRLPHGIVYALWLLIVIGGLGTVLLHLLKDRFGINLYAAAGITCLAFLFSPMAESVLLGQMDGLILLSILFFIYGYRHSCRWVQHLSETIFALFAAVKFVPFLLLAIPFFQKRYSKVDRVLAVFVGMLALSLLTQGMNIWQAYWGTFQMITGNMVLGWTVFSISSLVAQIKIYLDFPPFSIDRIITPVDYVVILISLAVFLWIAYRRRTASRSDTPLLLMGTAVMISISKLPWFYHLMYLVPVGIYYMGITWKREHKINLALLSAILCIQFSPVLVRLAFSSPVIYLFSNPIKPLLLSYPIPVLTTFGYYLFLYCIIRDRCWSLSPGGPIEQS